MISLDELSDVPIDISKQIQKIASALDINETYIDYHSNLKLFIIGPDRDTKEELKISIVDIEIFSYPLAFDGCYFSTPILLANQTFSHRITFLNCIFEQKVDFFNSSFKGILEFHRCSMKSSLKLAFAQFLNSNRISIKECQILETVSFENAYFESELTMMGIFECDVRFNGSTFKSDVWFCDQLEHFVQIDRTCFKGIVCFLGIESEKNLFLNNCSFEKLQFSNSKCKNVFLNNSVIKKSDFFGSRFQGFSLLNAKFLNFPLMLGLVLKEEINLTNTQIPDTFNEILRISKEFDREKRFYENNLCGATYEKNEFFARIRDVVRQMKYLASKSGNISESLNYSRTELYCRELELNSKNPPIFSKDWIEKWQLWFYRHTSDHHTDLMRIISWVIIAIGAFGLTFFWAKCIQNPSTFSHLNFHAVNLSLWGTIFLLIPYLIGWIKSFFIFAGSVGLIPILWIVCYRPSLIFGAVNLVDKAPRSVLENIVLVLYTLIMILLLFSLQKTARKNSIIPN